MSQCVFYVFPQVLIVDLCADKFLQEVSEITVPVTHGLCQEKASTKENNKKKSGKAGVHVETAVAEEIPCNPFELTDKGTGLQILVARLRLHELESSANPKMLLV